MLVMATQARERLLETAERLFYAEGVAATGVERILSESGVGRASFYRHFASKDELVVEVLRRRDKSWRAWMEREVAGSTRPARERPLAVFDALADRFTWQDFRGCAFINTMAEISDQDSEAFHVACAHKTRVVELLRRILSDAGYADDEELAAQFAVLIDGATVTALRQHSPEAAGRARVMAAALLGLPSVRAQGIPALGSIGSR
jgi:AcrR family transcriptional regulator